MQEYTISFKNGHTMKLKINDSKKFVSDLVNGYQDNPTAQQQIYCESGLLINVTDISACHPADMDG